MRMTPTAERFAGLLMLAGFVMLLVGVAVAPAGAYVGDIDERLAIIDAHSGQWLLSKVFDALALALPAAGFVTLSISAGRERTASLLSMLGGTCLALAGVVGLAYVVTLTTDAASIYDRTSPAPIVLGFISLIALGLVAFGVHFVRSGYPPWAGTLAAVVGGGVLAAEVLVLALGIGPEGAFGLAGAEYLGVVALAVVLIRR